MNPENEKIRKEKLNSLQKKIFEFSKVLGCSLNIRFEPVEDEPFVNVSVDDYSYIYVERGIEKVLFNSSNLDDFLEFIMTEITGGMATEYELKNRIVGQDSRRQWFRKHVELLSLLSPLWAEKQENKYKQILKNHPFSDE